MQLYWISLHFSLGGQENIKKKNNLPCLRPLQVVQEVLQVLADPQVPEYHLFQLGLEDLSLPKNIYFYNTNTILSVAICYFSVCRSNLYNVTFLPVHLSLQQGLEVPGVQDVQGVL